MMTGVSRAALAMLAAAAALNAACGNAVHDTDDAGTGGRASSHGGTSALGGSAGATGGNGAIAGATASELSCVVTKTLGNPATAAPALYVQVRFDNRRILTQEGFGDPDLRDLRLRHRIRLAEDGRYLTQLEEQFEIDFAWRADTFYDTERNLVEWRGDATAPELDLSITPPPPFEYWIGLTHTYDANGTLGQTLSQSSGAITGLYLQTTFEQDSLGRCSRITSSNQLNDPDALFVEERSYGGDRLLAHDITLVSHGQVLAGNARYEYDEAGRVVLQEQDGSLRSDTPFNYEKDGVPERIYRFAYAANGSISIEVLVFEDAEFNDTVDRNGVATRVAHTTWRLPPTCAPLLASIPEWTSQRCANPGGYVWSPLDLLGTLGRD